MRKGKLFRLFWPIFGFVLKVKWAKKKDQKYERGNEDYLGDEEGGRFFLFSAS
jgi:hypothetical protein